MSIYVKKKKTISKQELNERNKTRIKNQKMGRKIVAKHEQTQEQNLNHIEKYNEKVERKLDGN